MQTLNLIRPEESDVKYKIIHFPDGEPHITLEGVNRKDDLKLICRICNPTDLFILMQVGDILHRQEVPFILHILYLMSMRMDRVISYDESFSLKVVTSVINSMHPQWVCLLEPHSGKVSRLISSHYQDIPAPIPDFDGYIKVYPDQGASLRYGGEYKFDIICSKVRDPKTGQLSGFKIENPSVISEYPDLPFVVIDDLCDGGGTFKGIAELLESQCPGRKRVIYVTHMVNPKGIVTLSENYDKVYFTNSYKDWQSEILPNNVGVIKVV